MRSLLPLQIAVVMALCVWLWTKSVAVSPLPDWHQGELSVVVVDAGMDMDSAFGADLAAQFARHMNLKLRLVKKTANDALDLLITHHVHLAAGLRRASNPTLHFSQSYLSLDERVVCNGMSHLHIDDLYDHEITVPANSPQEAALRELRNENDDLEWQPRYGTSPARLLQEVAEGKLECTVASEEQIATMRNFYPNLNEGLSLHSPSQMSWAIASDGDEALLGEVNKFLAQLKQDGNLRHMIDRHYGHNERLGTVDAAAFIADTRILLPHYRKWFVEAADLTGLDWRLLAALAYRESHWDPNATSYTNVRGLMMLTEDTADRMGVQNRLDAHASILAGARYLQLLKEQLPLRISEQDRLWMALAAYNQGMGHLQDARSLTEQAGLNPDVWSDVKRVMPLLSRPAYFEKTKYGEARGGEAVVLVETVRLYHDMLKRLDRQESLYQLAPSPRLEFIGKFVK